VRYFDTAGDTAFTLDQQNIARSKGLAQSRHIVWSERLTVAWLLQPSDKASDIVEQ
jgi:hypothetical protein